MADAYLETLARMEPEIACVDTAAAAASVSISLKRIADALERLTTPAALVLLLKEIQALVEKEP